MVSHVLDKPNLDCDNLSSQNNKYKFKLKQIIQIQNYQ